MEALINKLSLTVILISIGRVNKLYGNSAGKSQAAYIGHPEEKLLMLLYRILNQHHYDSIQYVRLQNDFFFLQAQIYVWPQHWM